jgi:hypothetical protein
MSRIATSTWVATAIHNWLLTALSEVPQKLCPNPRVNLTRFYGVFAPL